MRRVRRAMVAALSVIALASSIPPVSAEDESEDCGACVIYGALAGTAMYEQDGEATFDGYFAGRIEDHYGAYHVSGPFNYTVMAGCPESGTGSGTLLAEPIVSTDPDMTSYNMGFSYRRLGLFVEVTLAQSNTGVFEVQRIDSSCTGEGDLTVGWAGEVTADPTGLLPHDG
jgi:hypothetical protein